MRENLPEEVEIATWSTVHKWLQGKTLISERTKEGLAAAKAKGTRLGRPKGARGKSVLDGKEDEICILLEKQVSKASIAKILGVSRIAVHHFIRSRNLDSGADAPQSQEHRP